MLKYLIFFIEEKCIVYFNDILVAVVSAYKSYKEKEIVD